MPEGDTVFLAARRLDDALGGQSVVRSDLRHPALATVDLAGRTVVGVASVGKHLLTRFDDDTTLHSHLRMDGSWHLYRPGRPWRGGPMHSVRAIVEVPDRVAVGYRLHDLALVPTEHEDQLVGHLGPDLLDPAWGPEHAAAAVANLTADPARPIGLALLDQRVMAGVGNLYRCEVCFLLGVSPYAPVSAVDAGAAVELSRELLLRNAWRPEQSTTGELGFGRQHFVFERPGKPCLRCRTRVRSGRQAEPAHPEQERVLYFCPSCQPTPRGLATPRSGAGSRSPAHARRRSQRRDG